jgi:hypothetical protein
VKISTPETLLSAISRFSSSFSKVTPPNKLVMVELDFFREEESSLLLSISRLEGAVAFPGNLTCKSSGGREEKGRGPNLWLRTPNGSPVIVQNFILHLTNDVISETVDDGFYFWNDVPAEGCPSLET